MRIAVVSPFIDRRHGTERAMAELLDRLARTYQCEIHLFAQSVQDLQVVAASSLRKQRAPVAEIVWHKVPSVPGPHLVQFLVWFYLNRFSRWRYARSRKFSFDLVLSPGVNCADANVILVHVLFSRLRELSREASAQRPLLASSSGLLRKLHRRFYYAVLTHFERRIYANSDVRLAAVSQRTATLLSQYFRRTDVQVIPNGVDTSQFSPGARASRRTEARSRHQLADSDIVLLLIGNDWISKGLPAVLQTMAQLRNPSLRLIVVGSDTPAPFQKMASELRISQQCLWQSPTSDVLDFYAAADIYVSPSREDSFGLPVAEAMACGLPVITSAFAGVSSSICHGMDGYALPGPDDVSLLSQWIQELCANSGLRERIGAAAAHTAQAWSWDKNAEAVWHLLQQATTKE